MTFYKLTPEEIMEMKDLSAAEMRVLLYLRAITPFGDRPVNMGIRGIAEKLELAPSTVSRALKKLDRVGYISMELLAVSVTITPFSPSQDVLRNCNSECETATGNTKPQQEIRDCNTHDSKPLTRKNPTTPQTNKTNKTNKKREKKANFLNFSESNPGFRDFCFRRATSLPERPVLIDSWMIANFEELKTLWERIQSTPDDKYSAVGTSTHIAKFTRVEGAITAGILRQDPLFPEGVYDQAGQWHKKADLEISLEPI